MGQITAHGNPHSSFSLSFFPLCVRRGFDEKILRLAVLYKRSWDKSGLKMVRNVNIVYGILKSENSRLCPET